ncbi:hypothetical protein SAMN04488515_0407 [Cognatiyoonia koreensis]|uniref:Uncharacterized protein n=1 Tax=Cognatiyoonia koreensis TaxID=364200 RepID=A0A1I0N508_9RHOB|nr:hypothetical protein SAMN04488515_0407 [Cognatiyoonia koreensis]
MMHAMRADHMSQMVVTHGMQKQRPGCLHIRARNHIQKRAA